MLGICSQFSARKSNFGLPETQIEIPFSLPKKLGMIILIIFTTSKKGVIAINQFSLKNLIDIHL